MTIETTLFDNLRGYDYHLALGPEYFDNTEEKSLLEIASLQLQTIITESHYYGQGIQEGLFAEYSSFSSPG